MGAGIKMELLSQTPTVGEMTNYIIDNLLGGFGFKAKEIIPYCGNSRFDVIGINRYNREIRIFEVKSCRQDFVSDKKWQNYLPYCTHFAFVAPKGVIKPDEIPKEIGLLEFWCHGYTSLHSGETQYILKHAYARGCKKLQEKPDDQHYIPLLEAITMRLMSTCEEFKKYRQLEKEIKSMGDDLFKIHNELELLNMGTKVSRARRTVL
jgi:hypothetical protein